MAVRYTYEPEEMRDAVRYLGEQLDLLVKSHAANWRGKFTGFVDEMTLRFDSLTLLMSMLTQNTDVGTKEWFAAATAGSPPPLPERPYDAMALVWQQVCAAIKKQGEGFMTGTAIDLPYVLSCAFTGTSLAEKFYHWALAYLDPFAEHLRAWGERIQQALPEESFDLFDLAASVLDPPEGGEEPPEEEGAQEEPTTAEEGGDTEKGAAKKSKSSKKSAAKKSAAKKGKGTKKGAAKKGKGAKKSAAKKGKGASTKKGKAASKGTKKGRAVTTKRKAAGKKGAAKRP